MKRFKIISVFPKEVNEKTARVIAGGVSILSLIGIIFGWLFVLPVLAIGFLLRVVFKPSASPLGYFAKKYISPHLGTPKITPGAPKRFAQLIGTVFTVAGSVLALGLGITSAGYAVLSIMLIFSSAEAVFSFCMGCVMFSLLMRFGLIPDSVCQECSDISVRLKRV